MFVGSDGKVRALRPNLASRRLVADYRCLEVASEVVILWFCLVGN